MRVLIAGCGDVGTALGAILAAAGHAVWGLRRAAAHLPGAIRPIAADLTDPATLGGLPAVEALVYAAAAGRFDDDAYRAAYVDGLANALAALPDGARGLARCLFVSSTGVYGQDGGEWVDEDSPAEPAGFSGARLLEGEAIALAGPWLGTVVRFGGIYGPGRRRLIERVLAGAECVERPPLYTNRIHRDDCAGVLAHLLGLEVPARVYLGVDCAPAPECEVLGWLASRLDAPAPRPIAATARARGGGNKRCRNDRLLASGFRFRYPTYREGYGAIIEAGGRRPEAGGEER